MLSETFAAAISTYGSSDAINAKVNGDQIQSIFHELITTELKNNGEPNNDAEPERIAPTTEALAFQSVVDAGGQVEGGMKSYMGKMLWMARVRYKSGTLQEP